jgi:hypothetical protein
LDANRYEVEGDEIGGGGNDGRTCDPTVAVARELTDEPNNCWNFGGDDKLW